MKRWKNIIYTNKLVRYSRPVHGKLILVKCINCLRKVILILLKQNVEKRMEKNVLLY